MTELRLGVVLPAALHVKKVPYCRHNNIEGEDTTPSRRNNMSGISTNESSNVNTSNNQNAATNPAVPVREPVVVETNSVQQVVSLQELLTSGIALKVDSKPRSLKEHAIDTGKSAIAVASGIGVAAGCYAIGKWVAGLFIEDAG